MGRIPGVDVQGFGGVGAVEEGDGDAMANSGMFVRKILCIDSRNRH